MTKNHLVEAATLFEVGDCADVVTPFGDFIQRISAAVADLPDEVRETAVIKIWASGEYANAYIELHRGETREETDAREEASLARDMRYRAEREADEARTYERLKAKFG